ncbi:MAG: hypothetical protein KJO91_05550, partial [Gammaproteobacteria bacterium]|nr:hypothetical protein [Gammaproteobacteria bacterium]
AGNWFSTVCAQNYTIQIWIQAKTVEQKIKSDSPQRKGRISVHSEPGSGWVCWFEGSGFKIAAFDISVV